MTASIWAIVVENMITRRFAAVLVVSSSVHIQSEIFVIDVANDLQSMLTGCLLVIVLGQALPLMDDIMRDYSILIFMFVALVLVRDLIFMHL